MVVYQQTDGCSAEGVELASGSRRADDVTVEASAFAVLHCVLPAGVERAGVAEHQTCATYVQNSFKHIMDPFH